MSWDALVDAGVGAEQYLIVAVSLAVSLLTLVSMTKIWSNAFWGGVDAGRPVPPATTVRGWSLMVGSTAALVVLSLAIAVGAGPVYALSERTAHDLIEPSAYIEAVLGR